VVGKQQNRAERLLRDAGFKPVVAVAFSDQIGRGLVISVDPQEATPTAYGSAVTITVSQGPQEFPVPNFSGLAPAVAEQRAHAYGLQVSFFNIPGTSATHVISQTPTPGSTVRYGDTVTLFVA
jgi:serine/threonine-protein kinase